MQMIMFFVGSDASGGTHITRTTTTQRSPKGRRGRLASEQTRAQIVMLSERAERLGLPGRVIDLDRPVQQPAPAPVAAHPEEEEIERWDGLY